MKIATWNVNGIRAAQKGGFLNWLSDENPDVLCVQEIKATPPQLDKALIYPTGYQTFWHPAQKLGYSGVAIFTKREPLSVREGLGDPSIDSEGRVLIAEFPTVTVINAYFPNTQREHTRLGYKLQFCDVMLKACEKLRKEGRTVLLCGDFNVAHKEIDLRFPKANENNAGFLPEEREWMSKFLSHGYVDGFRKFEPGGGHYTWWSYRPGVRDRNIGWRIDYHVINAESADRLRSVEHRTEVRGSDHCPVVAVLTE